jgi:hypothetical protein
LCGAGQQEEGQMPDGDDDPEATPARRNPNRACSAGNTNPVQPNSSSSPASRPEISAGTRGLNAVEVRVATPTAQEPP